MLPIKKIYIDTRFMSSDSESSSNFKVDLPTTVTLPEDTVFFILMIYASLIVGTP